MATFLYAWEIGGGLGHVLPALPVLRALRARGHRVVAALRHLEAGAAMRAQGFETHQAPWGRTRGNEPIFRDAVVTPESWAEDFLGRGYFHPADLEGLMCGWIDLCDQARAEVVIADFAPTALLAARALGVRAAIFGTGFAAPPRPSPIGPTLPWAKVDPERLRRSEARALATVNVALAAFGRPPLASLGDIYAQADAFVTGWPELDPYPQRPLPQHWPPIFSENNGCAPVWPEGKGPRAFAYLRPDFEAFGALQAALSDNDCRLLLYAGGATPLTCGPRVAVSPEPVDMGLALAQSDFVICHASHGVSSQALAAGRPLLLLPGHYEQALTARRIETLGAGVRLGRKRWSAEDMACAVTALTRDPGFATAARAFATSHAGVSQAETVAALADGLEALALRTEPGLSAQTRNEEASRTAA